MLRPLIGLSVALLALSPAEAQEANAIVDVARVCAQVASEQIPAKHMPSPWERRLLERDCGADDMPLDLYYGPRTLRAAVRARGCAIIKGQNSVLAMIYANGRGVARNYPLAINLLCRDSDTLSVAKDYAIADMVTASKDGHTFDLCQHTADSATGMTCADVRTTQTITASEEQARRFRAALPATDAQAFDEIITALRRYAEFASEELDIRFTPARIESLYLKGEKWDEFAALFRQVAARRSTTASEREISEADKRLRLILDEATVDPDERIGPWASDPKDIQAAQAAWERYRQAWRRFAHARYGTPMARSVEFHLIEDRIKALENILD